MRFSVNAAWLETESQPNSGKPQTLIDRRSSSTP